MKRNRVTMPRWPAYLLFAAAAACAVPALTAPPGNAAPKQQSYAADAAGGRCDEGHANAMAAAEGETACRGERRPARGP